MTCNWAPRSPGALLSAFFWGYLVTQIPGGWLASRIGPSRVIAVAMTITGATACLTGLVHSLPALLAVRVVMGLAEGVIWPSFAVIFVRWFPARERARGIAFAQYALPLSSVVNGAACRLDDRCLSLEDHVHPARRPRRCDGPADLVLRFG